MLAGCALPVKTPTFAPQPSLTQLPSPLPGTPTPAPGAVASPTLRLHSTNSPIPATPSAQTLTPTPDSPVRFAVIGDYGSGDQNEREVADLVKSWKPDFIITTGDNNYPRGAASTVDENVGQFYHEFIYPYLGGYGQGAEVNRFFPTLGNHDWMSSAAQPYFDYFTLPGNERYYDVIWGPVHLFALDSDSREPDGVGRSSTQAAWLQDKLANSDAPWKLVYMHHPPYSSGWQGPVDWTRWPFQEWGATAVISGHDHTYERILVNGFPYFVNGLGGGAIYRFESITHGSQVRFNADYGAMLVEADQESIVFQFVTRHGEVVDTYFVNLPQNLTTQNLPKP